MELYGIGAKGHLDTNKQIDQLTKEDVRELSRRLVNLDSMQVSVCGKSSINV
jgi:predicted Zn-dependent peptidase